MSHKAVVGLSGGVDSAVAALLLKQQGFEVYGVYLMCWSEPGCRAEGDRQDAMKVALQLEIPFQVLDFRVQYKTRVMDYFYAEYKAGRTPNPDVLCNKEIKFGLFYEWSISQGYDFIATGHYTRISIISRVKRENRNLKIEIGRVNSPISNFQFPISDIQQTQNEYKLLTALNLTKDQSYFLYRLRQNQLPHILFPIGHLMKTEVRQIARENNLVVAEKKDSMGICFVGDVNVRAMLKERYGVKPGEVQLADGTVTGEHEGYWFFTRGQRGGWKINAKFQTTNDKLKGSQMSALYVTDIKKSENVVVVGTREEGLKTEFELRDLHWLSQPFVSGQLSVVSCFLKVRNTGTFLPAHIELSKKGASVKLNKPEFGVAAGQSAVIYQESGVRNQKAEDYVVLGGGIIA